MFLFKGIDKTPSTNGLPEDVAKQGAMFSSMARLKIFIP
jgi:hypothetical protein